MNKFRLLYQTFRGPIHVRRGPSTEIWQIFIQKEKGFDRITFDGNPLEEDLLGAYFTHINDSKIFNIVNDVKPGTILNNTKDTPSKITELDSGKFEIFQESEDIKKYRFYGKKLRGLWFFNREDGIWSAERSNMIEGKSLFCTFDVLKSEEVTSQDSSVWIIEGIVSTSDIDSQNDRITEDALKNATNDLQTRTTILLNHDLDRPIGKILEVGFKPEFRGIWIKGIISKSEPENWRKIQEGILNKFSIRFAPIHSTTEYNKGLGQYVKVIDRILIKEASIVSVPANANAKLLRAYEMQKMLEEFLMQTEKEKNLNPDPQKKDQKKEIIPGEGGGDPADNKAAVSVADLLNQALSVIDSDVAKAKELIGQAIKKAGSGPTPKENYPAPEKKDGDPDENLIPKSEVEQFVKEVGLRIDKIVQRLTQ